VDSPLKYPGTKSSGKIKVNEKMIINTLIISSRTNQAKDIDCDSPSEARRGKIE
jgi:hypothetical protein